MSRLFSRLTHGRIRKAGFPGADDLDYSPLWRFFGVELNDIGNPEDEPTFVHHHKVARVLRDPRMPGVPVQATPNGEMSYVDLGEVLGDHPGTPVIIVATAGTTMTEALESLTDITAVLERYDVLDRYIHVDAALSGIPLALLPAASRPPFDFRSGADSIGFSLHQFPATRMSGDLRELRQTGDGARLACVRAGSECPERVGGSSPLTSNFVYTSPSDAGSRCWASLIIWEVMVSGTDLARHAAELSKRRATPCDPHTTEGGLS